MLRFRPSKDLSRRVRLRGGHAGLVGLALVAWCGALAIAACSGGDDASGLNASDGGQSADSAARDSGTINDAAASACAPANISGFEPTWVAPEPFGQDLCSAEQLAAFAAACHSAGNDEYSAACAAFRDAVPNSGCSSCIFGAPRKPTEGPLVSSGLGHILRNRAGCLANMTGDSSPASCAAAHQAAAQCAIAACATNCPLSSTSGDQAFRLCSIEAAESACSVFDDRAQECASASRAASAGGQSDGGAAEIQCLDGSELDLVILFCGTYGGDGGI